MTECPGCGCEVVRWAGALGPVWHACCRACGLVYETEAPVPDDDDE